MSNAMRFVQEASEGMALEASLFEGGGDAAVLWMAKRRSLVCPVAHRRHVGFDRVRIAMHGLGWPVYTRPTGGGGVPQGPGVLNLALAFTAPKKATIDDIYQLLSTSICGAAELFGAKLTSGETSGSFCDGAWNLSYDGRKVVGTAQRWRPLSNGETRVLAHALILIDADTRTAANAVGAYHREMRYSPISADAHTTLAEVCGGMDTESFAATLQSSALSALRQLIGRTRVEAA